MLSHELFEAIPLSLVRDHVRGNPDRPYDEIFNSFRRYRRKSKDRLYFPLKINFVQADASYGAMQQVIMAIREFTPRGIETLESVGMKAIALCREDELFDDPEDRKRYREGLIKLGNRIFRIGKVLNKIEEMYRLYVAEVTSGAARQRAQRWNMEPSEELANGLLSDFLKIKKAYETDPLRDLSRGPQSYEIVISRHPYDIAGMSTGRGWTSCTSLVDGSERKYVATYISTKCLIAYLVRTGDDNIEHPLARMNIVRFENEQGDFILVPGGEIYGVQDRSFDRFIQKWCKIVNRGKDDGLYCGVKGQQYARVSKGLKTKNSVTPPDFPEAPYY